MTPSAAVITKPIMLRNTGFDFVFFEPGDLLGGCEVADVDGVGLIWADYLVSVMVLLHWLLRVLSRWTDYGLLLLKLISKDLLAC